MASVVPYLANLQIPGWWSAIRLELHRFSTIASLQCFSHCLRCICLMKVGHVRGAGKTTRFERLLPAGAVVVEATPLMWTGGLYATEEECIARAVRNRRREFTAGRNCARAALIQLGYTSVPIGMGIDRAPVFPPGLSGSITHTATYCAAAVVIVGSVASIGIDAESRAPLGEELTPLILSREERAAFEHLEALDYDLHKLAFSAKEAFYKAYYQLTHAWLDFRDAQIAFDTAQNNFQITVLRNAQPRWIGRPFKGQYSVDNDHVYCAISLPADAQ
jgi:4'-phosphopantetheinyl transferase EntD